MNFLEDNEIRIKIRGGWKTHLILNKDIYEIGESENIIKRKLREFFNIEQRESVKN